MTKREPRSLFWGRFPPPPQNKKRTWSLPSKIQVPDVQLQDFLQTEPLFQADLGMTLGEVRAALLQPAFLERVFKADVGAFDMVASDWEMAHHQLLGCKERSSWRLMKLVVVLQVPANCWKLRPHRIRGFKYKAPMPTDIPAAVRSVLTLPPHGSCRAFCRLKANENEVSN